MNPIHLSADSFIKALQGEIVHDEQTGRPHNFLFKRYKKYQYIVVIEHVIINEWVIIGKSQDDVIPIFDYPILILGGEFKDRFNISDGEFKSGFRIEGGEFTKWFNISGGVFKFGVHIKGGEFKDQFKISGGVFRFRVRIEGGEFKDSFDIYGGIFKLDVRIEGGEFTNWLNIYNGVFHKQFRIEGGEFKKWFNIYGGEFKDGFRILGGEFYDRLNISGGEFHGQFNILGGEFYNRFKISSGEFHDQFSILGGVFKFLLYIEGGEFHDKFSILGGVFKNGLKISGGNFYQTIKITNNRVQSNINHLYINLPSFIRNKIVIQGANIDELTLSQGIASGGAVYISPIKLHKLIFKNFINEGKLEITGIQPKVKPFDQITFIRILRSNLDNAVFKGVAFDNFSQIIINDSKLDNINTIHGHFPTDSKKISNNASTITPVQTPVALAETYNQLRLAMQKQGNRLKEMEYYTQYLHWQLKGAKRWSSAHILLWLHRWSTNFGQSWLRGLGRMLLVGWVAYFLFSICLSEVKLGWQYFTVENVSNHTQYFLQWLLPTHKLNYIPHTHPGLLSTLFDILGRIAMGYMIYQTITAFRRFGRK